MNVRFALTLVIITLTTLRSTSQVYLEKQTRHRFAQTTLGIDFQSSIGGRSFYQTSNGSVESYEFPSTLRPRFLIGGTHFWGHADFLLAIPIGFPMLETNGQEAFFTSAIETMFKYYPWKIQNNRFRPFIGVSLSSHFFFQDNNLLENSDGPGVRKFKLPLLTGINYSKGNHLFELSALLIRDNELPYYITPTLQQTIETPSAYLTFSYRIMLESTIGGEKSWEDGTTARMTQELANRGKLSGPFLAAGLSSAWWLGFSEFNELNRPFIGNYGVNVMPEFGIGYYFHHLDLNVAIVRRAYRKVENTYGVRQDLKRRSLGFEVTKYLFDYHGFDPFIGPVFSREQLSFSDASDGSVISESRSSNKVGLTFGWDIRPDRIQSILLRTSLRYYPNLNLNTDQGRVKFDNIEFNFIQIIVFPNRLTW